MADHEHLPRAFLEALQEDEELSDEQVQLQVSEAMDTLTSMLEPQKPRADSSQQLLEQVSIAPLRYAPFFSRLGKLFDLSDEQVEASISRLADEGNWKRTGLSGVSRIHVDTGPGLGSASASFVRFAPGTHFPHHRHHGFEQVFVLEGSYTDDDGVLHGPGNLHEMQDATEHEFWAAKSEACIAANVLHGGLRFTRWPQKFFNFFMKD